ncbi:hypothetical protein [Micromonospora costi]|uniref:ESX-1 secretion-associated protein n=1 Tax=Micromonospora costi TaxID=1530042 RepID=A0A3A9ZU56_9ACTN|nr:hypothetical protein [Micromonospora costi]RKN51812.1 hypothetical protein D7193_28275 [Micromonospora costi]
MPPDIEVDVQAVRRLENSARQVAGSLGALEARIASAGDVPSDAFGHLPFASDMLRDKYAEQVNDGMELFRAAQAAFERVASALGDTVTAYERNEQEIDSGFKAIQSGMAR